MYTIEYQKRGLPHAHILLILLEQNKPRTTRSIDSIVCAEIPDTEQHPHSTIVSPLSCFICPEVLNAQMRLAW